MKAAIVHYLPTASRLPVVQSCVELIAALPPGVADLALRRFDEKGIERLRLESVRALARRLAIDGCPRIERRVHGFALGIGGKRSRQIAEGALREIEACRVGQR
ncbi:MAG: hypothetical protein V4750_14760 [Pseudomonadota bacterium]